MNSFDCVRITRVKAARVSSSRHTRSTLSATLTIALRLLLPHKAPEIERTTTILNLLISSWGLANRQVLITGGRSSTMGWDRSKSMLKGTQWRRTSSRPVNLTQSTTRSRPFPTSTSEAPTSSTISTASIRKCTKERLGKVLSKLRPLSLC